MKDDETKYELKDNDLIKKAISLKWLTGLGYAAATALGAVVGAKWVESTVAGAEPNYFIVGCTSLILISLLYFIISGYEICIDLIRHYRKYCHIYSDLADEGVTRMKLLLQDNIELRETLEAEREGKNENK